MGVWGESWVADGAMAESRRVAAITTAVVAGARGDTTARNVAAGGAEGEAEPRHFAAAASRAAAILADAASRGGSLGMEFDFSLEYVRRNVQLAVRAGADPGPLEVPSHASAHLPTALRQLATALDAVGPIPAPLAESPAGDPGRGRRTLPYDLSGGHVSSSCVELAGGLQMPLVGYGSFQMGNAGIRGALDAGYRLIDTAEAYGGVHLNHGRNRAGGLI